MALVLPPQSVLCDSFHTRLAEGYLQPSDIHVLLVDDEVLSRVVVGNLLRKCNYKGKCLLTINTGGFETHSS
jgi:hypothetical protein